ncbi:MAG: 30S ribosomal protein S9 [Candidatus Terrybacteria bacterium]|nr:30S ribosomal protein S9 [Candidatus Terrybacteria bacterium]
MTTKGTNAKKERSPRPSRRGIVSETDSQPQPEAETKTSAARGTDRYFQGVGRRKTAVARVKLFTRGDRTMTVNGRTVERYFPTPTLRESAQAALMKMNVEEKFRLVAVIRGGGLSAQAEALRHGTARALLQFNPDFRKRLKRAGYLTRDPRMVERKKPGKKKARRSPQWAKR